MRNSNENRLHPELKIPLRKTVRQTDSLHHVAHRLQYNHYRPAVDNLCPGENPMLQGYFGNASEIDVRSLQKDLDAILIDGEKVVRGFKIIRDLFIFTDKRLILIDKQGFTGKKA